MNTLRKYLTQYLVLCNKLEVAAENIRQLLAPNPYFQIASVYQRFDKFRKGFLEPADFSQFMLENQIYPTEGQLYLIFKDFDKFKRGVVLLEDFQDQLLPRENRKLKKTVLQRHAYPADIKLQIDLQFLLGKYFQDKINAINALNQLRDRMKILKADSNLEAFKYIDSRNCGYIMNAAEIDSFLRNNGKVLKNQQLQRVYRVLNFNLNTQISMAMFAEHLDPLALGTYSGYKQRLIQKQFSQKKFIAKKYQVDNLRTQNIVQGNQLRYEIQQLKNSNRRLRNIMDEQDMMGHYERQRWSRYY